MILVTGSQGLLGRHLVERLRASGLAVREFDFQRSAFEDMRDINALSAAMSDVGGVVHLAAVSRVVWAQQNPALTNAINVGALRSLLEIAAASKTRPWIVFGSSREVYGDAPKLPVQEDCPFQPRNDYARSKVVGEKLMAEAAASGMIANTLRFSSVYGCPLDYDDRVAPAFARAAALGGSIVVAGRTTSLDFTHVQDVAEGIELAIRATRAGESLPPLHFTSGRAVQLSELFFLAASCTDRSVNAIEVAPRSFGVTHFVGDPSRAKSLLGWQARTPLEVGFRHLVEAYRLAGNPSVAESRLRKLVCRLNSNGGT